MHGKDSIKECFDQRPILTLFFTGNYALYLFNSWSNLFSAFLRSFRLRATPGNGVGQYLRLPAFLFLGRRGERCGGLHGSVPAGATVLPQPRLVLEAGRHRTLVSCGYHTLIWPKNCRYINQSINHVGLFSLWLISHHKQTLIWANLHILDIFFKFEFEF